MAKDLRWVVMDCLKEISDKGLYRLALSHPYALASTGFLQEQSQRPIQNGSRKVRLFVDYYDSGYTIRISTKEVDKDVVAQHLSVIGPDGDTARYSYLNKQDYGVLRDGNTITAGIGPEEAAKKMLRRYIMISQHPD